MIRDLLTLLHNWRARRMCPSQQRRRGIDGRVDCVACQRTLGHPLNHRGVDMFDVEREWR